MPITTTPSGSQGEFSTYTPIYSTTFSSAASSITFSNIPTTFTDLVVVIGGKFSADISAGIYFNGDTGSNYATTRMWGNGTSAQSSSSNNSTQISLTAGNGSVLSTYIVNIMNYSNQSTYKPVLGRSSQDQVSSRIGMWKSAAPITSITFVANGGNFVVGTVVTVYGIKAAATQFIPTKAAGGDYAVTDGTYAYHVFKSSGIFAPAKTLSCDVLQVAGGGGGGFGGGGAGGLRYFASESLTATSYTVTVGAGGQAGESGATGSNGSNSQLGSLTVSTGGGGGGSINGSDGNAGGSGGGGGATDGSGYSGGGASPAGQGNSGGSGSARNAGYGGAGGGGGAGAGGGNAGNTSGGGAGGVGVTNSTINTLNAIGAATLTGQLSGGNYYYAGGGGGSANLYPAGSGGLGGGGNGYRGTGTVPGNPGLLNTGGGGGGVYNTTNNYTGGSGIVIVRYLLNA